MEDFQDGFAILSGIKEEDCHWPMTVRMLQTFVL